MTLQCYNEQLSLRPCGRRLLISIELSGHCHFPIMSIGAMAGQEDASFYHDGIVNCQSSTARIATATDMVGLVIDVFLIGYGVVAGFNVGDEKPPHD
jgi:hypothetical protein